MKEIFQAYNLSFTQEDYKIRSTYPIGDYFKNFLENYDLGKLRNQQVELKFFITEFDSYCQLNFIDRIELQSGNPVYPIIKFDRERKNEIKRGFIPVVVIFNEINLRITFGCLNWEVEY